MTKKIKIVGIVLIIALAISLIGLVISLYKYFTLEKATKDNATNSYTLVLIEDEKDDFHYRFESKDIKSVSTLYEVLNIVDDSDDDLSFTYTFETGFGYAIDSIKYLENDYGELTSNNHWEIFSPTNGECNSMENNYCQAGASSLFMGKQNIYELILSK
jgi:hypothetical protein